MERKFLELSLPRNESSTGANVPWNESSTGAKVLSVDFSLPGTKVLRNEKAWNHVTDRQTDRFAISISRVIMLTRDKNCQHNQQVQSLMIVLDVEEFTKTGRR